jgi:hypothetical protein
MDDGAEEEFGPGDAAVIPPGHNAWVVGDESVVGIDFTGLKEYEELNQLSEAHRYSICFFLIFETITSKF